MKYFLILIITLWTGLSYAADVEVEMLNKLDNEYMVFSKKIVRVDVGESVFWKATDKGHNVEFIKKAVPEGVEKFKSKLNEDVKYKFTIPGVYAYWCTPHKTMGMIGFVIVGNDLSNLDIVKKARFSGKSKKIAKTLLEQLSQ
jgi:pseudoazurin|tara:strand:- start:825 stop:1253 length:429 start_codon:yes stop_codon:yes gene_type:complete